LSIHSTSLGEDEPLVVSTVRAARMLDIGKTRLFELLREGKLDSVKLGRSRRIFVNSIRRLIEQKAA
jgi:excisionase family DNA binding protein